MVDFITLSIFVDVQLLCILGVDALPFTDMIEADKIDLLLVSHFHLDHAGSLPHFLQKTTFR